MGAFSGFVAERVNLAPVREREIQNLSTSRDFVADETAECAYASALQRTHGQTTSYHIGNSLTTDGISYNPGSMTGLQSLASLYGLQHEVAYHLDAGQSLGTI